MSILRSTDEYLIQLREEQLQVKREKLLGNRVYSTDVSVAVYQQKLNRIIHPVPPLVIDGQKGEKTVDAIYKLQKKYNLTINGEFDQQTIDALMKHDPLRELKVHTDCNTKLDIWELIHTIFTDVGVSIVGIIESSANAVMIDSPVNSAKRTPKFIKDIKKIIKKFLDRDLETLLEEAQKNKNFFKNKLKNAHKTLGSLSKVSRKKQLLKISSEISKNNKVVNHINEIKKITDNAFPHIFKLLRCLGRVFKFLNFIPAIDYANKSYAKYSKGDIIEGRRYLVKTINELIGIFLSSIAIGALVTGIAAFCAQAALPAVATTLIVVIAVVIVSVLFWWMSEVIDDKVDKYFNQYSYV